ncbi:MAG: hypothetical protein EHM13_10680, partial [Acidobacteria bacterium]
MISRLLPAARCHFRSPFSVFRCTFLAMSSLHVLILAAGKGTRMKSLVPKVLHSVAGKPMIDYVLETAASLAPATRTVIVGHMAPLVTEALSRHHDTAVLLQEPQLGTGHALMQAAPLYKDSKGTLVLLSGDVPRLTPGTLQKLLAEHHRTRAAATLLTAVVADPSGYGRVVRDA